MASSRERLREVAKSLFAERGYETASTAEICRRAGTSQSQLIKHFSSKLGLLQAIFQYAWEQINPAITLAIEKVSSPTEKLQIVAGIIMTALERDKELRTLFLLEGRRIRGDGQLVSLVPGFFDFVRILDKVIKEMAAKGELRAGIHPQAFRSGLMGAIEGMLRDQMLMRTSHFPAPFGESEVRAVFDSFLSSCLAR